MDLVRAETGLGRPNSAYGIEEPDFVFSWRESLSTLNKNAGAWDL